MTEAAKHVASAGVKLGGRALEMDHVEKIEVRNFVGLPDMATVYVANPEGDEVESRTPKIGDPIEISLGGVEATAPSNVFSGEVVACEYEFSTKAAVICVRAYDKSHRMHRNRRSATFQDMTLSDVVQKVASANGLSVGTVDSTPTVHPHLQQSMESDLDFVQRLAALENHEFGIADGKVFLRQQANGGGTVPTCAWRENALSFKPRVTAAQQHDTVKVQSYDPVQKKSIVAEATAPGKIPEIAKAVREQGAKFGASELLVADKIVTTQAEAQTLAQSLMDKLASGSFEAEGIMQGDPHVKAGGLIKLKGFGKQFDGDHQLSSVTHVYGHGDYRTRFAISGRNPRTLTDVMRPKSERDWTTGLVIGLVTNIDDKDKLGRIRVKFAALGEAIESSWARIASPGAGADAGMSFMPQVGDEVVVGFEHGDTRRPIVLGALHNTIDKPHEKMRGDKDGGSFVVYGRKDAELNVQKQLVIAAKEHMTMTVESGQNGPGDMKLEAKDKIEIKAGSTVKFESTGEMTVKSPAGITIEASGPLKLKGATVDIEASATVNVKGSLINLG
jgi:uncharacterized protein involved in type VI secretion and phage assembly